MRFVSSSVFVLLLLMAAGVLGGCEQQEQPRTRFRGAGRADGREGWARQWEDSRTEMRIVSLAPSLTQILFELGVGQAIVGVAEHDAVAPHLPVVGTFLDINTEKLHAARPTHVVMITGAEGPPQSVHSLADAMNFRLLTFDYPNAVADIGDIILDEEELARGRRRRRDSQCLGVRFGVPIEGSRVKHHMTLQLDALGRITSSAEKPDVLLVISVEPAVMASAPGDTGTVLDDLLGFAGGLNAVADSATKAPTLDREKLLAVAPDVVLLLLPGAPPLKNYETDSRLAAFRGLDIPAVREKRIVLINHPLILLPGAHVGEMAALIAAAIHPQLAEKIEATVQVHSGQRDVRTAANTDVAF